MDSPIFEQILNGFELNRSLEKPVYLQLAEIILSLIKTGKLQSGQKLPSSRELASLKGINRITVSKAYEELQAQGWLESFVGKGTFISSYLPEYRPEPLQQSQQQTSQKRAGFKIDQKNYLVSYSPVTAKLHLDDGFPDPKLAPLHELYRAYRNQLTRSGLYEKFGSYSYPDGSVYYREAISKYLNETRGLNTTLKNVLSVRGTLMGINTVCSGLIEPGDVIVSGFPGWGRAEANFAHAKAHHIMIPVDEHGLVVDELEKICKKRQVRMVYVTPHHHFPTTVPLRIDRRLELLRLAKEYQFIIFEDDYDFDFHYNHRPLLPLASADESDMVIYCGSFSKTLSPAFRMGYLVASENVIEYLSKIRLLLDRQGDHILDNAMGEILNDGTVQRYLRKTLVVYEERRNFFCQQLNDVLKDAVKFAVPAGGMSVWTKFDSSVNLEQLAKNALTKGLYLSDGKAHIYPQFNENALRLGFASPSIDELEKSVAILKQLL
ncbi:GntR family transcriptional regulator/MocR family aminotransferase [Chryseobacterium sp. 52]|uniref:aminotransferase-like domain-containing protein n=1 Tax=Chryseobacterium sp. 52 TaxID=2035213 RepID=UPI000C18D9CC|nr:PLP-dependent aminotransferase family protein [Chryseobacterium sp. 52]PIF45911.1 GntR family transcriptional regulator/MocR family aminotransferase [Chryseobacterium sp. 52]